MLPTSYLIVGLILVHTQGIKTQSCPSSLCKCEPGHPGKGRIINCQSQGLTQIPKFQPSDELFYELTLANKDSCYNCNNITHILPYAFRGLKVNVIHLDKNPVGHIAREAFGGLVMYLNELTLEGNGLSPPPYDSLAMLTNLRKLSLKGFRQYAINRENTDLSHLINLEELVYKNMDISYITDDAFSNRIPRLKKLRMEFLPLLNFPDKGLRPLTSLEELSIVFVNLRRIPFGAFSSFPNLKSLDLSHNNIDDLVPGCFAGIENTLEYLGLHLNRLDARNIGALASPTWRRLSQLNIAHNLLTKIPLGLFFNMQSLQYLNLASNRITSLQPGSLQRLLNLTFLDLSSNMLSSVAPGMFLQTPKLLELDISGQNTRNFNLSSAGLHGLENTLTNLLVGNTPVYESEMWKSIKNLQKIESLHLGGTGLTEIPDFQFVNNKHLEELVLQQNRISHVGERTFYGLSQSLKILYLQGNRISTIGQCTLRYLQELDTLYLGRNPLNCDCQAQYLRQWILDKIAEDNIYEYIIGGYCKSPQQWRNTKLWHVSEENLVCDPPRGEDVCEDITTRVPPTAATSTTQETIPTGGSNPVFKFTKIIETESGINLDWTAQEDMLGGFTLEYQLLGKTSESQSVELGSSVRNYLISGLKRNSHYLLCLRINEPRLRELIKSSHRTCIAVTTLPG